MKLGEILDSLVSSELANLGLTDINDVRVGKHISMELEANSQEEASTKVDTACKKYVKSVKSKDVHTPEKHPEYISIYPKRLSRYKMVGSACDSLY